MKRFVAILLLFVLPLCLFACKREKQPEGDVFYEVTFNTVAFPTATQPEAARVKQGEAVAKPSFDGVASAGNVVVWTKDTTTKEVYDFSAPVTQSFTLYAVEAPRTYSVTYLLEKGTNNAENPTSFTIATETILLQAPTMPFGYRFVKWAYYDSPDSVVTAIEQGTEEDIILRAVISPVTYTVTYFEAGDTNPNPTTYEFGTTLTLAAPEKARHRFLGYTIKSDAQRTPVTALTAEFILAHKEALFYENGTISLEANWEVIG